MILTPHEHPSQAGLGPDSHLRAVQGFYHTVTFDPHPRPRPHPHPQARAQARAHHRAVRGGPHARMPPIANSSPNRLPPSVPESRQLCATRMQRSPRSYYFLHQGEEPVLQEANSAGLATSPFYIQCEAEMGLISRQSA